MKPVPWQKSLICNDWLRQMYYHNYYCAYIILFKLDRPVTYLDTEKQLGPTE